MVNTELLSISQQIPPGTHPETLEKSAIFLRRQLLDHALKDDTINPSWVIAEVSKLKHFYTTTSETGQNVLNSFFAIKKIR